MKKNILVISSFPEKGITHGEQTVGGASYTKNTLLGMIDAAKSEQKELSITVLAEQLPGQDPSYEDQGIQVRRVWKRNHVRSWLKMLHQTLFSPTKDIFIAFELAMFGRAGSLIFFLIFLVILRLANKHITVICHHVIHNVDDVSGHLNIKKGSAAANVGTIFLKGFYALLVTFASRLIVFDKVLQEHLGGGNTRKISVIPHGVENVATSMSSEEARKKLEIRNNEFVLVSFGYLAWYKGTDWLIKAIKSMPEHIGEKRIRLIVAGGANPNRTDFVFYRDYVAELQKLAEESNGKIYITGYVPEDRIGYYYQAADCLLYPYRTVFSASGPLSLAFSYHKPFLLSRAMRGIAETEDFKQALKAEKLSIDAISFDFIASSFQEVLEYMIQNKAQREKIERLSSSLSKSRSFELIGKAYYSLLSQ